MTTVAESATHSPGSNRVTSEEPLFQSLPFAANFRGTTDIKANFTCHTKRMREGGCDAIYANQFRGRQLRGRWRRLPEGYCIALVSPVTSADKEGNINCAADIATQNAIALALVRCVGATQPLRATSYMVWSHDRAPSSESKENQWIDLANEIHGVA